MPQALLKIVLELGRGDDTPEEYKNEMTVSKQYHMSGALFMKTNRSSLLVISASALFTFCLYLFLSFILVRFYPKIFLPFSGLIGHSINASLFVFLGFWFSRTLADDPKEALLLKPISKGWLRWVVVACILLGIAYRMIGFLFNIQVVPLYGMTNRWTNFFLNIFSVGLLAGVGEEIFFRGWLLNALRKRMNVAGSIILTSLFFGLFHIQWDYFIPLDRIFQPKPKVEQSVMLPSRNSAEDEPSLTKEQKEQIDLDVMKFLNSLNKEFIPKPETQWIKFSLMFFFSILLGWMMVVCRSLFAPIIFHVLWNSLLLASYSPFLNSDRLNAFFEGTALLPYFLLFASMAGFIWNLRRGRPVG